MLPEWEGINHSNYARDVSRVVLLDSCQDLVLNLCVIVVEFLISANFNCYIFAAILNIEAFDNLAEGSFVNYLANKEPVTDLLPNARSVVTLSIDNLLKRVASVAADCEYLLELHKLSLFEHG